MLDTHRLSIFLTAVEETSFSAAAKKLKMSQPAVSLQIQALEGQLGLELFRRTGRSVVLTESGTILVPMARQMLNLCNHIEETMCALAGKLTGQLNIGCAATPGQYVLPRLILLFKERNPHVQIQLQAMDTQTVLERLLSQEIHLGVLPFQPHHRALKTRDFMEDELVLLVPANHAWANRGTMAIEDVFGKDVVLLHEHDQRSADSLWRRIRELAPAGSADAAITLGSPEALITAVGANMGAAFISRVAARRAVASGQGAIVELGDGPFRRTLYFCSNSEHPEVCVRVGFCDFVHTEEAKRLIRQWTEGTVEAAA
jgi:DNA-binding transcriptional LysR family regulator